MTFNMIHPIIMEVYYHTLQLDDYGDMIDGYWDKQEEIPEEIRDRIEKAAAMFSKVEIQALDILGSKERIQEQLEMFHGRRGKA